MDSGHRNIRAMNAYLQLLLDSTSQRDDPAICVELMEIYKCLHRPVSAYGYLLRAKRLGAAINPSDRTEITMSLKTGDIYAASKDPDGAYVLGSELAYYPEHFEPAVYYLQESVENGDSHGIAALELGELLETQSENKAYYLALAKKYFGIAANRGNPQYFSLSAHSSCLEPTRRAT